MIFTSSRKSKIWIEFLWEYWAIELWAVPEKKSLERAARLTVSCIVVIYVFMVKEIMAIFVNIKNKKQGSSCGGEMKVQRNKSHENVTKKTMLDEWRSGEVSISFQVFLHECKSINENSTRWAWSNKHHHFWMASLFEEMCIPFLDASGCNTVVLDSHDIDLQSYDFGYYCFVWIYLVEDTVLCCS